MSRGLSGQAQLSLATYCKTLTVATPQQHLFFSSPSLHQNSFSFFFPFLSFFFFPSLDSVLSLNCNITLLCVPDTFFLLNSLQSSFLFLNIYLFIWLHLVVPRGIFNLILLEHARSLTAACKRLVEACGI